MTRLLYQFQYFVDRIEKHPYIVYSFTELEQINWEVLEGYYLYGDETKQTLSFSSVIGK